MAAQAFMKYHSDDPKDFEEICKRGFELEEKLQTAAHKLRAFESKGEEQIVYANAADYADLWAKNADQEFNVFFICKGNQGEGWGTCNTHAA